MDLPTFIRTAMNIQLPVIGQSQLMVLVVLCLANLVLAVLGAVVTSTFDLVQIGNWAKTRLLPTVVVYAVAAAISWAMPDDPVLSKLRDTVFTTELLTLVALCLGNLKAFGITIPSSVAATTQPDAPSIAPPVPSPAKS